LLLLGLAFLILRGRGTLSAWLISVNADLNLDAGRNLIDQVLQRVLFFAVHLPHQTLLATGVILFASLELVEGTGLWLQRRWAEYLTVIATSIGIPFEVYEVLNHATPPRVLALMVNLAIVGYLIWRKRLFIDV
jgi:uncharacterized membrane protein (DUF2068 family)